MEQKMLLLKNIKLRIMKKKQRGIAEFITALFAMLALIIILFFTVDTVGDLNRIQIVDQIARGAVLKLETRGKLSSTEIDSIKKDLEKRLEATFDESKGDGIYVKYKDNSDPSVGFKNATPDQQVDYGTEVGIYIQCEVKTTQIPIDFNMFNPTMKKENIHTIKRMKTSISKAPTKN